MAPGEVETRTVHVRQAARSPRAAAIAGIAFSLLFGASMVLIRIAIPAEEEASQTGLEQGSQAVSLAIGLFPFAGIAFLWFMGVVRDRLGRLEDQFISTVFVGSGLLFLAMTFVSAALAGGLLAAYAAAPSLLQDAGLYLYARSVTYKVMNIYAIRMAGVFMMSLASLWVRTKVMPRGMAFLTYGLALVLLLGIGVSLWTALVFPAWVLLISVYILYLKFLRRADEGPIAAWERGA